MNCKLRNLLRQVDHTVLRALSFLFSVVHDLGQGLTLSMDDRKYLRRFSLILLLIIVPAVFATKNCLAMTRRKL